jgi:hypothetical protein
MISKFPTSPIVSLAMAARSSPLFSALGSPHQGAGAPRPQCHKAEINLCTWIGKARRCVARNPRADSAQSRLRAEGGG